MAIDKNVRVLMYDTETTNSLDDPLCYDLGYEVFDLAGNLYDRNSFVNGDVFCDKELMSSAYFLDKMPQYWEEIKAGKRQLASWYQITKELYRTIVENDVKIVCAHNARFDESDKLKVAVGASLWCGMVGHLEDGSEHSEM